MIKLRGSSHDLRLLSPGEAAGTDSGRKPPKSPSKQVREAFSPSRGKLPGGSGSQATESSTNIGLTLQTPINTLDLRGKDLDSATGALWDFLDRALLRGEEAVIVIHGHGEGTLKAGIRTALRDSSPYDLRFRPGMDQEGGDGVTVVQLKS